MKEPTGQLHSLPAMRRALLSWFRKSARDLPWRESNHPWRVWVSEIMLQQTRVETVIPYYLRFVKSFPTVGDLARAKQDTVIKHWEGLGYYSRVRNLQKAAQVVTNDLNGVFPESVEGWMKLPGVGRYTAGAITSIAYGVRAPVLDGNVKRVLARLFAIRHSIDQPKVIDGLWELADELVPAKSPGDFNQAMMELGACICTPKNPECDDCPLKKHCIAFREDLQSKLPVRKKKKRVPHHTIVIGAIEKNGKYLIGKRPEDAMLGGLWEFPGGKVEKGESLKQALRREITEETNLQVTVGKELAVVQHAYSHFSITMHLFQCTHKSGRISRNYHTETKWVSRKSFSRYAFPTATLKCFELLNW